VAHARVYLPLSRQDSLDRDVPQWITTTSDSQGRFAFRGLPERTSKYGWYSLFAIHPDAGWTINVSRKIIPRNQSAVYVLILSPPTELITGHVVNPEKEPIAGAKVEILSASYRNLPPGIPEMNTITNQNGRFLLRVPPETQVVLKGTEDSYAPGYRNAMAGAQSTIVLFPASYIIAKFIDEETQQPVEGIPVKIVHPYDHYDDPIIQKSDPNGEARIKVPSETEFILYSENPTPALTPPSKAQHPLRVKRAILARFRYAESLISLST
ncbi:MAG: carboxypeptidase-like regulatory domain-containing protein, partial [Candidatus Caldarchaeum sp.]